MSVPFLLEIGVEEVPDWMIEPALDHLKQLFSAVWRSTTWAARSIRWMPLRGGWSCERRLAGEAGR